MAHRACSGATALVGITPHFVDWALGYAGRTRSPLDRDFPLAYPEPTFSEAALSSAIERWGTRGVTKDKFVVCFLGTFGAKQFLDMETVIGAARVLSGRDREILFVLCGTGVGLDYCRSRAADCSNVLFPGWVGAADIWALMRLASVGLAPYQSSPSFVVSIPNKAIEYLCGGLPVVSSLRGSLDELLSVNRCGVTYGNGDAQGLATLLAGLSEHPERVSDMSANARAVHESRFNAERVYGEFADHLVGIGTMPRSSSRSQ
jgi:glycosyltransferase involved in cell wall biosynthesis